MTHEFLDSLIASGATAGVLLAVLEADVAEASRRVTVSDIQRIVAAYYKLSPFDMTSARRSRAVARPRQIAMYLARHHTQQSMPAIGRRFGGRDHTTVIHAVRRVEALIDCDGEIAEQVAELEAML